jgi:hypothetical protein
MENTQLFSTAPAPVGAADSTVIQADKTAQLEAGIVVSVFGIQLSAAFEKGDAGVRVLVSPATENPHQSVSLKSVCDGAKITNTDGVDAVLTALGFTGGVAGTEIDVNQAFYYYSSIAADASDGISQEYALSLALVNTGFTPSLKDAPFTIERITFALWNSKRPKIVKSMGLQTIAAVLAGLS